MLNHFTILQYVESSFWLHVVIVVPPAEDKTAPPISAVFTPVDESDEGGGLLIFPILYKQL